MAAPSSLNLLADIITQLKDLNNKFKTSNVTGNYNKSKSNNKTTAEVLNGKLSSVDKDMKDFNKSISKSAAEITKSTSVIKSTFSNLSFKINPVSKMFDRLEHQLALRVAGESQSQKELAHSTLNAVRANTDIAASVRRYSNAHKAFITVSTKLAKANKVTNDEFIKLRTSMSAFEEMQSKGIDIYAGMTDEQIKYFKSISQLNVGSKLSAKNQRDVIKISQIMADNFKTVANTTKDTFGGIADTAKLANQNLRQFANSLKANLIHIALAYMNQGEADVLSQARNQVSGSNYKQAGSMRMSEAELAEFQGQFKWFQKLASKTGNSTDLVNSGGAKELYDTAKNTFGVVGAENLKMVGETANQMISMGIRPTADEVKKQMKFFGDVMANTGMSLDELSSTMANMSQNPAFLAMANGKGFDADAIRKEIKQRLELNRSLGISNELMMKRMEQDKGSLFGDFASKIKQFVGAKISGKLDQNAGMNISDADNDFYARNVSNASLLTGGDKARFEKIRTQKTEFNLDRITRNSRDMANGNFGSTAAFEASRISNEMAKIDPEEGLITKAGKSSISGAIITNQDNVARSLADVNNQLVPFAEKLTQINDIKGGIEKNPIGASIKQVIGTITDVLGLAVNAALLGRLGGIGKAGGLIGKLGGGLSGAAGAIGGGLSSAAGAVGKFAMGRGGALLGTGLMAGAGALRFGEAVNTDGLFSGGTGSGLLGAGIGYGAAKLGGKLLGKSIPGVGLAMGVGGAANDIYHGQYKTAGIEALSGAASLIPGIGTAASLGLSLWAEQRRQSVAPTATDAATAASTVSSNRQTSYTPDELLEKQLQESQEMNTRLKEIVDTLSKTNKDTIDYWEKTQQSNQESQARSSSTNLAVNSGPYR